MTAVSTRRRKGVSLAKGPIAIVGILGIAMGVCGLIFGGHGFHIASVPHGSIYGKRWLGIELNGWTNLLFIAAGLFLLLFSPVHWGAKAASWIVAGVLGAAAVIAVIRGNGIFGIFAADHRTELVWGAAAVVLLALSLLPRVGRGNTVVRDERPRGRDESALTGQQPAAASHDESPETRREPDPGVIRERSDAGREREAVAREEPDMTRDDPGTIRDQSGLAADDPDTTRDESSMTRGDRLVSPREDRAAGSDESTARP